LNPRFAHEQLQVYAKALAFGAKVSAWTGGWSKKHALVDQHHRFLQIADRASVKAAVYLDLAVEKGLVDAIRIGTGKELLRRVSAMLGAF